jgi:hypothetical protein
MPDKGKSKSCSTKKKAKNGDKKIEKKQVKKQAK